MAVAPQRQAAPIYQPEPRASEDRRRDERRRDDDDNDYRPSGKGKRRDSFLSDIFDF